MTSGSGPVERSHIAAFDPGRNVGYALVDDAGRLIEKRVLNERDVSTLTLPEGCIVLLGDGTGRDALHATLQRAGHEVTLVDERGTSLAGRALWREHEPARGWQRLLPSGLRSPDQPIDDYAAWAIALRFLETSGSST